MSKGKETKEMRRRSINSSEFRSILNDIASTVEEALENHENVSISIRTGPSDNDSPKEVINTIHKSISDTAKSNMNDEEIDSNTDEETNDTCHGYCDLCDQEDECEAYLQENFEGPVDDGEGLKFDNINEVIQFIKFITPIFFKYDDFTSMKNSMALYDKVTKEFTKVILTEYFIPMHDMEYITAEANYIIDTIKKEAEEKTKDLADESNNPFQCAADYDGNVFTRAPSLDLLTIDIRTMRRIKQISDDVKKIKKRIRVDNDSPVRFDKKDRELLKNFAESLDGIDDIIDSIDDIKGSIDDINKWIDDLDNQHSVKDDIAALRESINAMNVCINDRLQEIESQLNGISTSTPASSSKPLSTKKKTTTPKSE